MPNPLQFAAVGGEMAGTAFLGYLIDLYFQTIPVCTVVGAIFGIISSGFHLFRIVSSVHKKDGPKGVK